MLVSAVDFQTDALLTRVFYPTESQVVKSTGSWLPRYSVYASGLVRFLSLPKVLFPLVFVNLFCTSPVVPLCEPLAKLTAYPVVIFSHGLGGMRSTYSHFCSRLASHGFVVFAVEHKDGSACHSHHKSPIQYTRPTRSDSDYLLDFRRKQTDLKVGEVKNLVALISLLNQSGISEISLVSDDETDCNQDILESFKGRLDLDNLFIVGHSFGGASTLSSVQETGHPFKAAVVFDPWMHSVDLSKTTTLPILSIQSSSFHWRENYEQLRKHFDALTLKGCSRFAMLTNSTHEDFSDFPIMFPLLTRKANIRGSRNPSHTLDICVDAVVEFIQANCSSLHIQQMKNKGLLDNGSEELLINDLAASYILEKLKA